MGFMVNFSQQPVMSVFFLLIGIYLVFWVFISVVITVSKRAREYFSSFFPQWFGRSGRPFTKRERIGAGFQAVTGGIIVLVLLL